MYSSAKCCFSVLFGLGGGLGIKVGLCLLYYQLSLSLVHPSTPCLVAFILVLLRHGLWPKIRKNPVGGSGSGSHYV